MPEECETMISEILQKATDLVSNPDIKDRAFIYWRMLSTSPSRTYDVVLGKKPQIASDTYNIYDEELVDKLIGGLGNLSSLYHKTQNEWSKDQKKYVKEEVEQASVPEDTRTVKKEKPKKVAKVDSDEEQKSQPKVVLQQP